MTKFEGMMKRESPRNDFDNTFWNAGAELVVREETSENRVYDLEERTARFGEMIIDFAKTIPQNPVTDRIIGNLSVREPAFERTTSKRMMRFRRKGF